MKMNQNAIVLGLAAVAVYFITQSKKKPVGLAGLTSTSKATAEIFDTTNGGSRFANGWRYFSDGTAIDPNGDYYQGGQLIWQNPTGTRWAT